MDEAKRIKVILNPTSDHGRAARYIEQIRSASSPQATVDLVLTEAPGHAQHLAREAAANGYPLVVAAGGDGTVHEVINGLVSGAQADATLGVIPIGSGNDFAYALGIPTDVQTAVSRLTSGRIQTVDLARIETTTGRFQIVDNNIGIGFDAIIVIVAEGITRVHGFWMYLIAVLRTILFYFQTLRLAIRFDDEQIDQESLFLAFGIGPRGGGGFFLTPDASQTDDRVDTCLVKPIGRLTMLYMLGKVLKGRHTTSRFVQMRQSKRIVVKADKPMPIHVDGEMFAYPHDDVRQVTITSLPAVLRVVV